MTQERYHDSAADQLYTAVLAARQVHELIGAPPYTTREGEAVDSCGRITEAYASARDVLAAADVKYSYDLKMLPLELAPVEQFDNNYRSIPTLTITVSTPETAQSFDTHTPLASWLMLQDAMLRLTAGDEKAAYGAILHSDSLRAEDFVYDPEAKALYYTGVAPRLVGYLAKHTAGDRQRFAIAQEESLKAAVALYDKAAAGRPQSDARELVIQRYQTASTLKLPQSAALRTINNSHQYVLQVQAKENGERTDPETGKPRKGRPRKLGGTAVRAAQQP